ncbi:hypothetical protein TNCV_1556141 [Trichonephila clavipes]|nr:hypothetical protein TNCV_1556141 [Trichonephila clavipes]
MIAQTVKQRNDVSIVKGTIHRFLDLVRHGYWKRRSRQLRLRINFPIRKLGVLYPYARRFLEKSYASVANKTYQTIAIQVDASTAPKSAQSESVQPKSIAVDTRKTVSTPPTVKKLEKHASRNRGAIPQKRGRTSLKNSMTWETMSWTFTPRKATKVLWTICRPDLRLLAPCEEQVRRLHDLLYLLELPWSKDSTC